MPSTDGSDYLYIPQILKANGDYFPQAVIVQNIQPVYTRQYSEVVVLGTNATAFANIGDGQDYIDSFTIFCFGDGAYREVKENIAKESTNGIFTLRWPTRGASSGGDAYSIRFFEATFSRVWPRRQGVPQIYSADVENIQVL